MIQDDKMLKMIKEVLNEELRSIITIFQANQPTESSRMTRLVSDVVSKELQPIKEHLSKQDIEIKQINEKLSKLTSDTEPLVEGKKTVSSIFKFILWSSPIAVIYTFYKWLKL